MAVLQLVAPILPGKYDQWRTWHDNFVPGGSKRAEWKDQMQRYNITRQCVSLQRTPHGDFVVLFFEGPDPGAMMAGLGNSDNEFDKWFAQQVKEIHGIDTTEPPPGPISELVAETHHTNAYLQTLDPRKIHRGNKENQNGALVSERD